jgi:hypothetical protein
MASILDTVRPGDVISSDLINRIIGMLNEHDALLSASSGGPLSITSLQPPSLRMGETLTVIGSGLSPGGLKRVSIDGVDVQLSAVSGGGSQLAFTVPPILGIPDLGQTVTLTVENLGGATDSATFFLLPGIATNLEASFNITRTTVTPGGNLAPNTNYEFTYSIETFSSKTESYFLEPQLLSPSAGWSVSVKGGQTDVTIPKSQPTPSTTPITLIVRTGPAGGASVTLGLRAKNFNNVTGSSIADPVSIGATPGAPNLDVEFLSPVVQGAVQKFSNGSLYVRTDAAVANQRAIVNPLNVRLKVPGIYTIGTPIVSSGSWTVTVTNNPLTLDTTGTPGAIKPILFNVQGAIGAPDADVEIPVIGAGALPDGSFKFKVKLRADPSNPAPI